MASIRSHLLKYFLKRSLRKAEALSLQERRRSMDANAQRFKNAKGVRCLPVDVSGMRAEWLIPEHVVPDAAVLYLHGGAYTVGSIASHRSMVSHIAKSSGTRVLLLDYLSDAERMKRGV